jgi:hypothetical protein
MIDDAYNYGSGLKDLPSLLKTLHEGSMLTGIGIALGDDHLGTRPGREEGECPPDSKVHISATDWDAVWPQLA